MASDLALSIVLGPVGVMIVAAAFFAAYALTTLSQSSASEPDALKELFDRTTLEGQLRDAAERNVPMRRPRRAVRGRAVPHRYVPGGLYGHAPDHTLERIAKVMRGAESDADKVREAQRFLESKGFVMSKHEPERSLSDIVDDAMEVGDFEDVKLLPAPAATKAA